MQQPRQSLRLRKTSHRCQDADSNFRFSYPTSRFRRFQSVVQRSLLWASSEGPATQEEAQPLSGILVSPRSSTRPSSCFLVTDYLFPFSGFGHNKLMDSQLFIFFIAKHEQYVLWSFLFCWPRRFNDVDPDNHYLDFENPNSNYHFADQPQCFTENKYWIIYRNSKYQ